MACKSIQVKKKKLISEKKKLRIKNIDQML